MDEEHTIDDLVDAAARQQRGELARRLVDAYYGLIHAFFKNRGFSEEDCRDLTQETFLRAYLNIDNLRSEGAADAWLRRIAANLWKNELRRNKTVKRNAKEISLEAEIQAGREGMEKERPIGSAEVPDPCEKILTAENLSRVEGCLRELPPKIRRCLVLHVFQERSYRDIAELLGLSVESVKTYIHQARQRLRSCLARQPSRGGA